MYNVYHFFSSTVPSDFICRICGCFILYFEKHASPLRLFDLPRMSTTKRWHDSKTYDIYGISDPPSKLIDEIRHDVKINRSFSRAYLRVYLCFFFKLQFLKRAWLVPTIRHWPFLNCNNVQILVLLWFAISVTYLYVLQRWFLSKYQIRLISYVSINIISTTKFKRIRFLNQFNIFSLFRNFQILFNIKLIQTRYTRYLFN